MLVRPQLSQNGRCSSFTAASRDLCRCVEHFALQPCRNQRGIAPPRVWRAARGLRCRKSVIVHVERAAMICAKARPLGAALHDGGSGAFLEAEGDKLLVLLGSLRVREVAAPLGLALLFFASHGALALAHEALHLAYLPGPELGDLVGPIGVVWEPIAEGERRALGQVAQLELPVLVVAHPSRDARHRGLPQLRLGIVRDALGMGLLRAALLAHVVQLARALAPELHPWWRLAALRL
mmetsp:Transcript_10237/g.32587  ORF Transcript_10237/g.32587 Transcript_10237/m.32587 type:complete len:237 (+) Transcript_10237:106-816(+)